jgi:hypothetical protein
VSEDPKKLLEAVQREIGELPSKPKYPLPCGCHGPKYISKCDLHQVEQIEEDARRLGIVDLTFCHHDFTDLAKLFETLQAIKLRLISNPFKSCIIKVIPNETDARGPS